MNVTHDTATGDLVNVCECEAVAPTTFKSLLTLEDAEKSIAAGASGVIVSNHGRQLDGAGGDDRRPARHCGPGGRSYADADRRRVRRGTDAFKALALGARAVLMGRPYWWGLAAAGETAFAACWKCSVRNWSTRAALAGGPTLSAITQSPVTTRR